MLNNEILRLGELAAENDVAFAPFSGEAWKYALEMTLLGMGLIFAVLGVLWAVLLLFKVVFAITKKEDKKVEAPKVVETPKVESAPAPAATDDTELIALLTAAIVAYESENGNDVDPSSFRVVSFRRTNGGRAWNSK